jgi:hypothetical protein
MKDVLGIIQVTQMFILCPAGFSEGQNIWKRWQAED